jgi:exopolyphosphatase/pppGpp-phosphohydrolase
MELSENHRRSVSITLQLVDQALCEWDDWTKGQVRSGMMYRQQDTFSPTQKDELHNKITKIRQLIARLRDDLRLEARVVGTSQSIIGQAALLWEMLLELDSRSLQGYGKVSEELARYLDPIANQLAAEMNEISRLFSQPTSAATTGS